MSDTDNNGCRTEHDAHDYASVQYTWQHIIQVIQLVREILKKPYALRFRDPILKVQSA